MKKYLVLYNAPNEALDKMMKDLSPEDSKKMDDDWNIWMAAHKDIFVDQGSPIGKNKRVTRDGVTDTRNEVNGYSIIQAESHEAAAELMRDNPQLQMPGAYIEVVEWYDMPEK